jgi:hypothetical protein
MLLSYSYHAFTSSTQTTLYLPPHDKSIKPGSTLSSTIQSPAQQRRTSKYKTARVRTAQQRWNKLSGVYWLLAGALYENPNARLECQIGLFLFQYEEHTYCLLYIYSLSLVIPARITRFLVHTSRPKRNKDLFPVGLKSANHVFMFANACCCTASTVEST